MSCSTFHSEDVIKEHFFLSLSGSSLTYFLFYGLSLNILNQSRPIMYLLIVRNDYFFSGVDGELEREKKDQRE